MTVYAKANSPGTTTVARTARIAAAFDHTGIQSGRSYGAEGNRRAGLVRTAGLLVIARA
jgi:hypothetical protein